MGNQAYNGAFTGIGSISGTASFGFGNYHGMTAKLEKRLSNGLQFVGLSHLWPCSGE